jgi:vancomycin permeability regulator SanA
MNWRGKRVLFHIVFAYLPLLGFLYIVIVFVLIRRSATTEDAQPADIIVVLGAAQYNGRPSPVFKVRLDHSVSLFRRNYARLIMTTGGHGLDPRFSEAGVGKAYLLRQNIPEQCIVADASGSNTTESIERSVPYLKMQNFNHVIAVSDGFHLFRIKQIFRNHQITAYGSPARNSLIESNAKSRISASVREVFVYTAYLIQYYTHLHISAFRSSAPFNGEQVPGGGLPADSLER